ncbi:hypothetical protein GYMLUDRAFT_43868 [Collybiopsis luxurians FD-317 M1]|uniref:Fungal STAND N-terminal Goodbye domain-containing protein n=1 Tax=Collybiopsis luxurians FD-317 M1 TaxID=944289 RepID=A0A0D0BWU9_9AGAR|nr:hypothetical protein GYMLUDRAFT_43868 [Collybiopsis luxurians FD-317 M1]
MSTTLAIAGPLTSRILWAKALANYKEKSGHDIFEQHKIDQFPTSPSIDDVVRILETQSKGIKAFREKGKNIRDVLNPIVSLVRQLNDTGAEAAVATSVPGGKAIFVVFGVLLEAAKGTTEVYDALEELSNKLQDALNCVKEHLDANPELSPRMNYIYIQMLVQVIHIFGFLIQYPESVAKKTQSIIWEHSKDFGESLLGEKGVQEALWKLDKLTNRESLMRIARIHKKVDNNETKMVVMRMNKQSKEWLSPPDVYQHYNTIHKEQHKGTGTWLFKPNSKFY